MNYSCSTTMRISLFKSLLYTFIYTKTVNLFHQTDMFTFFNQISFSYHEVEVVEEDVYFPKNKRMAIDIQIISEFFFLKVIFLKVDIFV